MIKVHCFVSCVCEVLKKTSGVDHRPYYFGVWDADFDVLEHGILTYHSQKINHEFFQDWYELLYNIKLRKWYDEKQTKQENMKNLIKLVEDNTPNQYVMVMLDLSKLPERENKFHQSPFPHYVMLEATENKKEWFMYDPDFRWEGTLPKNRILAAMDEPTVGGGYVFDASTLSPPSDLTVNAYFNTCMEYNHNRMTEAVSDIINLYTIGEESHRLSELSEALRQLPVLAIRKYAYEHAFAYFYELIGWNEEVFESWCEDIEKLVKGFTAIYYKAMKLAMTGDLSLRNDLINGIKEQDQLEFKIKFGLKKCYEKWSKLHKVRVADRKEVAQ